MNINKTAVTIPGVCVGWCQAAAHAQCMGIKIVLYRQSPFPTMHLTAVLGTKGYAFTSTCMQMPGDRPDRS